MAKIMNTSNESNNASQLESAPSLTFFQMVGSILASFFGVQSAKNRDRDFAHGKARAFILVGILMTVVWYGCIWLVVHFVLK